MIMLRFPALPLHTRGRTIDEQTVLIALNCMVACLAHVSFIFSLLESSENLASHDFDSVEYSAVPLCTLFLIQLSTNIKKKYE